MDPKNIIELIRLHGWKQSELASRLGVNRATVTRWINGERIAGGPAQRLMAMWLDEARRRKKSIPV